eukprot:SAG11_NODE_4132_length_2047_cov_1.078542_2_plen_333_part_00
MVDHVACAVSAWKQREIENTFLWGSEGFVNYESPRPQFRGTHIINPITNRETVEYSSQSGRYARLIASQFCSFLFLILCGFCAVKATALKYSKSTIVSDAVTNTFGGNGTEGDGSSVIHSYVNWQFVSSILNLCLIVVGGEAYRTVAGYLTTWENHRTNTEWKDSLIVKEFSFAFINNYFVLFYISYVEPYYQKELMVAEGLKSSLPVLKFQLMIVFTVKTIGKTAVQVLRPRLKRMLRMQSLVRSHHKIVNGQNKMHAVFDMRTNCCCFDRQTREWLAEVERDEGNVDDEYVREPGDSDTVRALEQAPKISVFDYTSEKETLCCYVISSSG